MINEITNLRHKDVGSADNNVNEKLTNIILVKNSLLYAGSLRKELYSSCKWPRFVLKLKKKRKPVNRYN